MASTLDKSVAATCPQASGQVEGPWPCAAQGNNRLYMINTSEGQSPDFGNNFSMSSLSSRRGTREVLYFEVPACLETPQLPMNEDSRTCEVPLPFVGTAPFLPFAVRAPNAVVPGDAEVGHRVLKPGGTAIKSNDPHLAGGVFTA